MRRVIEADATFEDFDDMTPPLDESILRGIVAYGFEKPSLVQQNVLVPLLKGRDCLIRSNAGTGKTACYCISILQRVDFSSRDLQALVMCPGREIAYQVENAMKSIGEFRSGGPFSLCVVGGTSVKETIEKLKNDSVLVIVGNPGRAFDLHMRGLLYFDRLKILVLDEADYLMDRGFKDVVVDMIRKLPSPHPQIAMFSSTTPAEVRELSSGFQKDPFRWNFSDV